MKNSMGEHIFFRRISLITLSAVYFLILVGGIVRSSGSGMGCPDWPKCFGAWIPPAGVQDLPADYKQEYVAYRMAKNARFAGYLEILGMKEKADMIRNDPAVREETEFNVMKTWTEYLNRLTGVAIGILIMITLTASFIYIKKDSQIFVFSLVAFFLVVFQGWIGSVVVSSNLIPWMVTLHMMLAVLLIAILTYIVFRSRRDQLKIERTGQVRLLNTVLVLSLVFIAIQIVFGTQVRESIDSVAALMDYKYRDSWIDQIGLIFFIHRSFSILILIFQLAVLYLIYKSKNTSANLLNFTNIVLAFMLLEVGIGVFMAYFDIPPYAQPLHLMIAVLIFGLQMFMILVVNNYSLVSKKIKVLG